MEPCLCGDPLCPRCFSLPAYYNLDYYLATPSNERKHLGSTAFIKPAHLDDVLAERARLLDFDDEPAVDGNLIYQWWTYTRHDGAQLVAVYDSRLI